MNILGRVQYAVVMIYTCSQASQTLMLMVHCVCGAGALLKMLNGFGYCAGCGCEMLE